MAFGHTPPRRDSPTVTRDNKRAYPFRDGSNAIVVTVEVPAGIDVTPVALDWKSAFEIPGAPQTKVINLVLQDSKGAAVKNFSTAFTIRVKHNAANGKLKYFDPDRKAWVDFGVSISGGEFVVNRSTWFDDPGIGID